MVYFGQLSTLFKCQPYSIRQGITNLSYRVSRILKGIPKSLILSHGYLRVYRKILLRGKLTMVEIIKHFVCDCFPKTGYLFYSKDEVLEWVNKKPWGGFKTFEECVPVLNSFGYEVVIH